jgi:hypothetical protein
MLSIRLWNGGIAQLGERVLCKHEVVGSIPSASTRNGLRFGTDKTIKQSVFTVSANMGSSW